MLVKFMYGLIFEKCEFQIDQIDSMHNEADMGF